MKIQKPGEVQIGNITFKDYPVLLAPMEDITDPVFRAICKGYGADMMYTEFVSSEGLVRMAGKSIDKMKVTDEERPIGIQVFGHDIESMQKAVEMAEEAGPDLIDINFGCPVKKVVNKGAGSAIMKDVPKMISLTSAVVKATRLPVTVKTRLGWDQETKNITEIAEQLQDTGIQALTIHGRTRSQLYSGKADWTLIGEVKNNPRITIPIIGNGDIDSPLKAKTYIDRYGVDGIMIGRAAIGNPFIFREVKHFLNTGEQLPPLRFDERIDTLWKHLELGMQSKGERKGFLEMRKQYNGYFRGIFGVKPWRVRLVLAPTIDETREILEEMRTVFAESTAYIG